MNRKQTRIAVLCYGCLATVAVWLAFSGGESARSAPPARDGEPVAAPVVAAPDDRPTDKESVQKALDGFVAAFRSGDAKAVAGSWTTEGEYTDDEGTTYRGRAALEKAYTEFFTKNKGYSLEVEVDSVRFPSKETAVVEGHFKLRKAKGAELIVSKCSLLYAREDGSWRIAIAREWASDGLTLRDLEWLIGTWEAKRPGVTVSTKYEWTANKAFIRCTFSVTRDGDTHTGTQMIVRDPATGELQQWTFEDSGGIGSADITRDGKKWIITARGTAPDGRTLTATNIMTPIDADTFMFHSVERTVNGEEQPDLPPVKVTRVKTKP
ncbi:Steroid delta5-4-isomerase OS=Rhodopirellula sp. SWK7 GN=RRSWK_01361 PE=4 SV=1: SnoaL_3 [Gemmata massiliana]|uniref:DUF4440 domain-containing protein n=1 Tax=Gemmata massiliana TaxID=1210884 RepID=A0A6P2D7L3_9BACT|nr:SgcJ/EcaC family oxidoreductase [Gemmata massiliana]VTR97139.1 Steroid delta5-4-isomerase OS=Rhodopirellula sp. SWK7 GN=RRSWK_01361 PE=4 SV=1: SnoaL_3 [Gemmata massiliana]